MLRPSHRSAALGSAALAAFLLAGPVAAVGQTLPEAVDQALRTHPSILAAEATAASSEAEIDAAEAGWFPFLTLRVEGGGGFNENNATRLSNSGIVTKPTYNANFSLSQIIFDGFETENRALAAEFAAAAANRSIETEEETIALRVAESYLETLRQRQLLILATENLGAHQRVLDQVRQRAISGAGPEIDVTQAEARLASAESDYVDVTTALREAEARFLEATGAQPGVLQIPRTPIQEVPAEAGMAVNQALVTSPQLQAIGEQVKQLRAEVGVADSDLFPELSFEGGVAHEQNGSGVTGRTFDAQTLLRLNYELSVGGRAQANVRSATAKGAALAQREAATRRTIARAVRLAFSQIDTLRARVPILTRAAVSAEQVVDGYRRQFELGRRSLLDVLDVERELFQIRSAQLSAEYAFALANYQALAAIGRLADIARNIQSLPRTIAPPQIAGMTTEAPQTAMAAAPAPGPPQTPIAAPQAPAAAPATPPVTPAAPPRPQTAIGPDPAAPPPVPARPVGPPVTPMMGAGPPQPATVARPAMMAAAPMMGDAMGRSYAVQVGVYSDPRYAEDLARALRDAGYPMQARPGTGDGALTVIRMSGYSSEMEAQAAARAFRDQSGLGAIVVREDTAGS